MDEIVDREMKGLTLAEDKLKVPLKALGEFTHSTLVANKTLVKTLNTKAYLLLSSQPWRRYVLAISFADFHI